jgi:hypothetical protein
VAILAVVAPACGDVHFVPAPFTPLNVQVIYSAQEQISIIRWQVSSTEPLPDIRFELLGPNGYEAIDFSRSVFPGGVNACAGGGSCAQYVVRGMYPVADDARPVRAVHERYGVLPGGRATVADVAQTLSVDSFFHAHNDLVYASMNDAVAVSGSYHFPRPYERAMWPTSGLCVSDAAPDGVQFSSLDPSGDFPPETPLTDSGTYCVAARPLPADGGAAALVQTRVATAPVVSSGHQSYQPPVERAPVIYQIVLDLEIPVADRCAAAVGTIERLVDTYLGSSGTPVHKLATMNLAAADPSSPCSQVDGRSLPSAGMAETVKQLVATLPELHQQFHFLYFNNLDAPLPDTLTQSLQALFAALVVPPPTYDLQTISWLFNPGGALLSNVQWSRANAWITADDPQFEMDLATYAQQLPYTTQVHDSSVPVPLLSAADVQQNAGHLIKVCTASPSVQPVSSSGQFVLTPSWLVDAADPPAYEVALPVQVAVPAPMFVAASAEVDYQLCTRYCADHPYVSTAGVGVVSWDTSPLCAAEDY